MPETRYKRLTWSRARTGFGLTIARCSLWLGEDHLLSVETNGYSESYKRFYFRDIQAIVTTRTPLWLYWALALGLVAALLGAVAAFSGEIIVAWVFGPVSALVFLAFIYNLAAGPSCDCELQTAVQTEQLCSLARARRARRVIRHLATLMAAAQGELEPQRLGELMQRMIAREANVSAEAAPGLDAPPVLAPEGPPLSSPPAPEPPPPNEG